MSAGVVTVEEFTEFRERVIALRNKFEEMGRKSRGDAGHETRLGASRMSNVLTGRYYDLGAIESLEVWMSVAYPEWQAKQTKTQLSAV